MHPHPLIDPRPRPTTPAAAVQPAAGPRRTPKQRDWAVIALCAGAALLGACNKTAPPPPTPQISAPAPAEPAATSGPTTDPSVPPAETVFAPASHPKEAQVPTKTDGTRSPEQEAQGQQMPLPGQNNDHSAPLTPAPMPASKAR